MSDIGDRLESKVFWQGRVCGILRDHDEAGHLLGECVVMSAVNRPDDFDFAPDEPNDDAAFAMSSPATGGWFRWIEGGPEHEYDFGTPHSLARLEPLPDGSLLMVCADGHEFVAVGNPTAGGRVILRTAPTDEPVVVTGGEVMKNKDNPPIVGVPVMTTDNRLLCYACYQDDESAVLDFWIPEDVENYPTTCEACGQVLIHESQRGGGS